MVGAGNSAEIAALRLRYLERLGVWPEGETLSAEESPYALTAVEGIVARVFETMLGTTVVDVRQQLPELGGSAVPFARISARVVAELRRLLDVELEPWVPYVAPCVRALADVVTKIARSKTATGTLPVLTWRKRDACSLRLFCFPFGGGSATIYQKWADKLPDWIELGAIEPPGRGHRLLESPWRSQGQLIEGFERMLGPHLDRPFAFYGHSAGAYMAFAAACWCRSTGRPLPVRLFVGAFWAPSARRGLMVPDDVSDEGLLAF